MSRIRVETWSRNRTAREVGISVNTLDRFLAAGSLPGAFRVGKRWHIPVTDIQRANRNGWAPRLVAPALVGSASDTREVHPSTAARTADSASAGVTRRR